MAWYRDTRDSALAPRSGRFQNAGLELGLPGGNVQYAKATYLQRWYIPLGRYYTLFLRGEAGIGKGFNGKPLPTFKMFYAGGIGSVRGYDTNATKPRNRIPVQLSRRVRNVQKLEANGRIANKGRQ